MKLCAVCHKREDPRHPLFRLDMTIREVGLNGDFASPKCLSTYREKLARAARHRALSLQEYLQKGQ